MQPGPGSRRPLLIVLVLLVISMLLDRYLISYFCPWMSSFGGISLMVVFLDIPLALPQIDPLPVAILFSLFYSMMPHRSMISGLRLSSIWGGVLILACWMAAGALAYHFAEGFLPRQVRNGIDSFGIHVDIYTPFTEYSILPLRGGFILLLCFIIGGRTLVKRVNRAVIAYPVPEVIQEPGEIFVEKIPVKRSPGRIAMTIEEPILVEPPKPVRSRAAVRSVAIVAPRPVEIIKEGVPTSSY